MWLSSDHDPILVPFGGKLQSSDVSSRGCGFLVDGVTSLEAAAENFTGLIVKFSAASPKKRPRHQEKRNPETRYQMIGVLLREERELDCDSTIAISIMPGLVPGRKYVGTSGECTSTSERER
ncbi:hypothetical protein QE152_g27526 [Popillia japonica]|uniref:Uncharacterized protein n=1 Tax=Popillia japonica TaxID=7064 RepID=A0AAW1JV91_POPJA